MNIQSTDAQALFTKKLIDVYKERVAPQEFLETFFPTGATDITDTLELSIEVQRATEKVAVDVVRGSDGNRNEFTKSTEKIFIPPYFREYWDQNHMQAYDNMFRASSVSANGLARLINQAADHMEQLEFKIRRAIEIQRAQVLDTGIVTFDKGLGQIDFKRKASSKVDLTSAGGYWATNNNIYAQLQAGCEWLRKNGKVSTNTFEMICGDEAITALMANTVFLGKQDLFHMKLDNIMPPRKVAAGAVYHGTLSAGPYQINVWSYPEWYENAAGNLVPIMNPKNAVLLPPNPRFKTAYAMTPQLLSPGQQPQVGRFIIGEYTDEKKRTREFHIESAPLAIPTAVDHIYTMKAVAG
jgi:Phage major capsid protein E